MTWLKQSTATDVELGPFVDSTDGVTAETGLTISQADCQLIKNGGAAAQKNDATSATHLAGGHYKVPLNTTDTNTLGRLRLYVNESGAVPVWRDFMVVPSNVWDSLFGADKLQVHADEITAGLITAAAIATGAIDADAIASDAVTEIQSGLATAAGMASLNNLSAAQVNAEVVDALATDTYAELGAVPAATASLKDKITWLYMLARNERRTTATTDVVRNDANSSDVGTSTMSENGTTFTRGEYA
jgi:hypothetical protein